jgi:putative transcriptional regulator
MERTVINSVLEERTKRGMTQEALAHAVDVSRQTIIAIEKGKYTPSVALALRIAHAFGARVEDLFHIKGLK